MTTYRYVGQRYSQGKSALELVTFCAPARDIKQWGGVPSKTERYHGGFQRALGKRYVKIKEYFDDGQASPTSIVVAFRKDLLKTSNLAYPDSWTDISKLSSKPRFVLINFELDDSAQEDCSLSDLRKRVVDMLSARLALSSDTDDLDQNAEEEIDDETSSDSAESIEGEDQAGEQEEEQEEELDVGHSKLKAFCDFIANEQAVEKWIKEDSEQQESKKAKLTKRDPEFVDATSEEKLKFLLSSLLRPAMIVDGQHRVWGAYNSDEAASISFTVNAIKDADWIEQVFQFVVLNKLAHPISAGFLTSILNTSLTNTEVHEIEARLDKIGIKNTDRKIMKYLNHNEKSPFRGLISEPGEVAGVDNRGKLSDKGMIRLARRWLNLRRRDNKKQLEMFNAALGLTKITEVREKWAKYETWTQYFFAFWDAIKARYQRDGVWEKKDGFHLLYIVTMHAMQDIFLESKAKGDGSFADEADFKGQVDKFFGDVPATFFQSWEATGLQSGDGPGWIKGAIQMFRDGKKLSTVRDQSPLFQKPSKK